MSDRELKKYLQQSLQQETEHEKSVKKLSEKNAKLEETIKSCIGVVREQKLALRSQ